MACERFAEALKARALGVALRPDGAAHLAVCSTCQAVLEREERLISAINTAIEEVGTAKPAPDFVPAMRASIARTAPWKPQLWSIQASALAMVFLAISIAMVSRFMRESHASAGDSAIASRPVDLNLPSASRPTLAPTHSAARLRQGRPRPSSKSDRAVGEPEVLVPTGERQAVGRLFDALREGRPEVVSMLMSIGTAESRPQPAGLTVAPLRIESVVVSRLPSAGPLLDK